jgi:Ca-activated chloride channel family protein
MRSSRVVAFSSLALMVSFVVGCGASAPSASAPRSEAAPSYAGQPSYDAPQAYPQAAPPSQMPMPGAPPPPMVAVAPKTTAPVAVAPAEPVGTEHFTDHGVNPVTDPTRDRFSTFSIDVDTASYTVSRRKLVEGTLPPFAAVRAEEYVNFFRYGYEPPKNGKPFAVYTDAAPSPFTAGHHLVRVGLQGRRVSAEERKPVHLVYLVDTSGSMQGRDRIELAKKSLRLLTDRLKPGDTVALCTYAGGVEKLLDPTGIDKKDRILAAIDGLRAGGSTAMGDGIALAYDLAKKTLVKGHVNRVVVLSDGDANVGHASGEALRAIIRGHRGEGITLSTVGFGSGNYKDAMMEQLADSGDGNYTYIDSEEQARHVFVDQLDGLLQVIARDVKIQVELDPSVVTSYRLIGYENRDIADKDFRNDKVDAGEVGSGHTVTALYDVVLKRTDASPLTVRVRHKAPLGSERAEESVFPMKASDIAGTFEASSPDFRFATAVAGFAEVLRKSPHAAEWRLDQIASIASNASLGRSERTELASLVNTAARLSGKPVAANVGVAVAR